MHSLNKDSGGTIPLMRSTQADTRQKVRPWRMVLNHIVHKNVDVMIYIYRIRFRLIYLRPLTRTSSAWNILTIDANSTLQIRILFSDENWKYYLCRMRKSAEQHENTKYQFWINSTVTLSCVMFSVWSVWLLLTVDNESDSPPNRWTIQATALEKYAEFRPFAWQPRATLTRTRVSLICNLWLCAVRCAQLRLPNRKFPILRCRPFDKRNCVLVKRRRTESSFSATRRTRTHSVENRLSRRTERKIISIPHECLAQRKLLPKISFPDCRLCWWRSALFGE